MILGEENQKVQMQGNSQKQEVEIHRTQLRDLKIIMKRFQSLQAITL